MIVATAGHVDHGKTTLIKGITGVDTDRLPEEKKRGLSIDLGFAFLTPKSTDGGSVDTIGFIDVPGHEKFVRNMIAGVGSIDLALVVVAADDGPMPQTREHLAILQLLGVGLVIVVLTKTDLVESDRLIDVKQQIKVLLASSAFPAADTLSAPAGDQIALTALKDRLVSHAKALQSIGLAGHFRLAIDRSFSVTGSGTVVTGTVISGSVKLDDSLALLSSQTPVRVRGIHAQNKQVDLAVAGQRCALNITGSELKNTELKRGDWLTSNENFNSVRILDASVTPAPQFKSNQADYFSNGIKHWTAAHLHLGAASVPCRIALLESELLAPGENGLARLICEQPLGAVNGDRFVLRDQSAQFTIAGGVVIDPFPPRRGRSRRPRLELLHAMNLPLTARGNTASAEILQPRAQVALQSLLEKSPVGLDLQLFAATYNCRREELREYCAKPEIVTCDLGGQWWGIEESQFNAVQQQVLASLDQWHASNPNVLGASIEQLSRTLPVRLSAAILMHTVVTMIGEKQLTKKAAVYASSAWSSSLDEKHENWWIQLQGLYVQAGDTAPRVTQLSEAMDKPADEVLQILNTFVAHGRLYRVSVNRYYTPDVLHRLACIGERLSQADNFTVAAFRDESGIGRNLVIELLEFFDRNRFTRRVGQKRTLIQSADKIFGQEPAR